MLLFMIMNALKIWGYRDQSGSLPARILNSIFGINSPGLFDELGDVPSEDVIFDRKTIDTSKIISNNEIEASNSHTLNLVIIFPRSRLLVELLFWEV